MADASESSRPFSTSAVANEEQWARLNRAVGHQEGIVISVLTSDPPDLKVTGTNASTVTIGTGEAAINGFYYQNTAAISRSVPSNAASATARVDTVVLEANQSTNEVTVKYVKGGSAAPALTRVINGVWQMPIARVTVKARATTVAAVDVIDRRQFVMVQGIYMTAGSEHPVGKLGQLMYTPEGLHVATHSGDWDRIWPPTYSGWKYPTLGTNMRPYDVGAGDGTYSPAYAKFLDGIVYLRGRLEPVPGHDLDGGDNPLAFTLPAEYRPANYMSFLCMSYTKRGNDTTAHNYPAHVTVSAAGSVRIMEGLTSGGWISFENVSFWTGA